MLLSFPLATIAHFLYRYICGEFMSAFVYVGAKVGVFFPSLSARVHDVIIVIDVIIIVDNDESLMSSCVLARGFHCSLRLYCHWHAACDVTNISITLQ